MTLPSVSVILAQTESERDACFQIRLAVFVQEQNVSLELEMDAHDDAACHFLLLEDNLPRGTARLLDKDGAAKIGRVAVVAEARGRGLGHLLMRRVLDEARRQGFHEAVLDSQTYAMPFYERLGFAAEGPEFDEAGIPHRRMRRVLNL